MSTLRNRRDDEVRRQLLAAPHPVVPVDLAARAVLRGRRIVRRRRIEHAVLWALLVAAVIAGIVLAVLGRTAPSSSPDVPADTWWSQNLRD